MIQSSFTERNLRILFPLPAVIFIGLLMVFPILYTLYLSFTSWNLTSGMDPSFVGLNSYLRVFSEPRFLHAIGRTFSFTASAVAIEVVLGVAIALILNRAFVGKSLAKLLLLLPRLMPRLPRLKRLLPLRLPRLKKLLPRRLPRLKKLPRSPLLLLRSNSQSRSPASGPDRKARASGLFLFAAD